MYERTAASIVISNPVRDGVIADINNMNKVAETLLKVRMYNGLHEK